MKEVPSSSEIAKATITDVSTDQLSSITHGHLEKMELYKKLIRELIAEIQALDDGQEVVKVYRIPCPLNKILGKGDTSDTVYGAKLFKDIWSFNIPTALQQQGIQAFAAHNGSTNLPWDTDAQFAIYHSLEHDSDAYSQNAFSSTYSYQKTIFSLRVRKLTEEEKQVIRNSGSKKS